MIRTPDLLIKRRVFYPLRYNRGPKVEKFELNFFLLFQSFIRFKSQEVVPMEEEK